MRPTGSGWVLPGFFFGTIAVLVITSAGAWLGLDLLGGSAFMAFIASFVLGLAVVFGQPDRRLPEKTRAGLQKIRIVAGVILGLMRSTTTSRTSRSTGPTAAICRWRPGR